MARTDTLEHFLTDVADSIREKAGTSGTIQASTFDTAISNIPTSGGGSVEPKNVLFYDYLGNLVYSYIEDEINDMQSLPPAPEHEGMEFQEWNWTLRDIKTYIGNHGLGDGVKLVVGETCITDDGNTRLYMNLCDGQLQPTLGLYTAGTVTIDWGDGSNTETITGNGDSIIKTVSHTYDDSGRYTILLTPSTDLYIKGGSSYTNLIYNDTTQYSKEDNGSGYKSSVEKIELGDNIIVDSHAFKGLPITSLNLPSNSMTVPSNYMFQSMSTLTYLTLPKGVTKITESMFNGAASLKAISLPKGITQIDSYAFKSSGIKYLSMPDEVASLGSNIFESCGRLEYVTLPVNNSLTSLLTKTFMYDYALKELIIPDNITTLPSNAFTYLGSRIKEIIFPDSITSLPTSCLYSLQALNKVIFLGHITYVESNALSNCYSLEYLDFTHCNSVPTMGGSNFQNFPVNFKIIVPSALYSSWVSASGWSTYASHIISE